MTGRILGPTSAAVVIVSLWGAGQARADAPRGPVVVVTASGPGCATCETPSAQAGTACASGTGHRLLGRYQTVYVPTINPGSCFGYYPTQWRKWEEVCPYPPVAVLDPHSLPAGPYPMIPPSSDKLPKANGVAPKKIEPTVPPPPPPGSRIK